MHGSAEGCRGEREHLCSLWCPGAVGMDVAGAPMPLQTYCSASAYDVEVEVEDTNDAAHHGSKQPVVD